MTQDGLAAGLALSRAHVALELKRLKTTGRAQERMAHVAHARSRRKVYELTHAGQEVARRMREPARPRPVQLNEPQGVREVLGSDAIEALRRSGLRESEAVQMVLAADVIELPRLEVAKAAVPSRPFFGRREEHRTLREWLASDAPSFAILLGVAGIGKSALVARLLSDEPRPTFIRRVYAHDDAHGLLSSFADFLARQGRRRLKAVITRPAYDPTEAIAVMRGDLSGFVGGTAADVRGPATPGPIPGGSRSDLVPAAPPCAPSLAPPPGGRIPDPRPGEGVLPPTHGRRGATGRAHQGRRLLVVPGGRPRGNVPSDRGGRRRRREDPTAGDWARPPGEGPSGRPRGRPAPRPPITAARWNPPGDAGVPRKVRRSPDGPRANRRIGWAARTAAGAHPARSDRESPRGVQGGARRVGGGGPRCRGEPLIGDLGGSPAGARWRRTETRGSRHGDRPPAPGCGCAPDGLARTSPCIDGSGCRPDRP